VNQWHKPLLEFLSAFAAVFLLSACWAFATPISAVPDEPSHAVKAAAVVRGQLGGKATTRLGGQEVLVSVPGWVAETQKVTCFAFHPDVTPSCWEHKYESSRKIVTAATTAGNYNPAYYAIVGLPSLVFDGKFGFYSMRLTSAALNALIIAAAFLLALRRCNGRWTAAAIAIAVTPMVLFLNGSVNPNSLEFSAMIGYVVGLRSVIDGPRRGFLPLLAFTVASGALLANAKSDGLLWVLLGTAAVVSLSGLRPFMNIFRRPTVLVAAGLLSISMAFAAWWIITNGAFGAEAFGGAGMPWWNGLLIMFDRTGDYASGVIGYFGWLDAPAPQVVIIAWEVISITLVVLSLIVLRGRGRVSVLGAVLALIIIPPVLQAAVLNTNGLVWQGRYNLALFALVAVVAGLAMGLSGRVWTLRESRALQVVAVVIAIGHAYAFLWALRRYVTGLSIERTWFQMVTHARWQPPLTWELWVIVFTAVCTAVVLALWQSLHSPHPAEPATLSNSSGQAAQA
jgi:hypothetical protein